jgi:hypothetical protein
MNATFQDMEQLANPMNGTSLTSSILATFFQSLAGREPFMFELRGENGFMLTVGVAADCGTVQYSPSEGLPPYLMARGDETDESEFMEFLAGGTPTPIPKRFCLPLDRVQKIMQDFFTHGEKSDAVEWEEI